MNTSNVIKGIYNIISNDETICRYLYYAEQPLNVKYNDLVNTDIQKKINSEIYRFVPQPVDTQIKDKPRICIYKGYMKDVVGDTVMEDNLIQIDLYIPNKFMYINDLRVYDIEDKIVSLLQFQKIENHKLDYNMGIFVPIPSITEYCVYKMTFNIRDIKYNSVNRYGKY